MQIKLSPDDIETIISEADTAARRLRRRLGLPACDREDLGQDLLIDLLRRLPAFDPARGSLGAFAGLVLRNQSSRIAIRIMRERRAQGGGLLSLDAPSGPDDQRPLAETIGEDEGLSAWHGQATTARAFTEQHQAVQTAISRLPPEDRRSAQRWRIARFRRSPPKVSAAGPRSTAALPISATSSQPMASVPSGTMWQRPE